MPKMPYIKLLKQEQKSVKSKQYLNNSKSVGYLKTYYDENQK